MAKKITDLGQISLCRSCWCVTHTDISDLTSRCAKCGADKNNKDT